MPEPKKPRAKKPKQSMIPGTEPESIPEIDNAAENYVLSRDSRMENLKSEIKYGQTLLDLLQKHKLTAYEYDGKIVALDSVTKVKVRNKKEKDPLDE